MPALALCPGAGARAYALSPAKEGPAKPLPSCLFLWLIGRVVPIPLWLGGLYG